MQKAVRCARGEGAPARPSAAPLPATGLMLKGGKRGNESQPVTAAARLVERSRVNVCT